VDFVKRWVSALQRRIGMGRAALAFAAVIGLLGAAAVIGLIDLSPFGTPPSWTPFWGWFLLVTAAYAVVIAFVRFGPKD
jgi:hypothetical protein